MNSDFEKLKALVKDTDEKYRELTTFGSKASVTEAEIKDRRYQVISACEKHVIENTPNIIRGYNICVIEPYFLEFEWNEIMANMLGIKRNPEPEKNLERLLKNVNRSFYNTILFENYRHYVLKSHELVDKGVIDKVIFTDKCGREDLKGFTDSKQNYICGSIAHQCLKAAKKHIREYAPFFSIRAIRDCISHYEPNLWHKFVGHLLLPFYWPIMSKEDINDISFHIPSEIYSLMRGVNSSQLL